MEVLITTFQDWYLDFSWFWATCQQLFAMKCSTTGLVIPSPQTSILSHSPPFNLSSQPSEATHRHAQALQPFSNSTLLSLLLIITNSFISIGNHHLWSIHIYLPFSISLHWIPNNLLHIINIHHLEIWYHIHYHYH